MNHVARTLVVSLPIAVAALACHNNHAPATSRTTTTGALMVTSDEARSRLIIARCDRETTCNDIGQGKRYDDRGTCERKVTRDVELTVRADQCPWGVYESHLLACTQALGHEACGVALKRIDQIAECTQAQLCGNQTGGHVIR